MFFWRLTSVIFLIIGLFLFIESLLMQNISFFYWAMAFYSVASLIWLTIQQLYVDFSMPRNPKNDTDNWYIGWIDGFDILEFIGIILSLPKIIFLFLIHAIYS